MFWFSNKQSRGIRPSIGLSLGALVLAVVVPLFNFGVGVVRLGVVQETAAVATELTNTRGALIVAVECECKLNLPRWTFGYKR